MKILTFCSMILLLMSCNQVNRVDKVTLDSENMKIIQGLKSNEDIMKLQKTLIIDIPPGNQRLYKLKMMNRYLFGTKFQSGSFLGMIWDNSGRFIGNIGNIGKGPGEYISLADIVVISDNKFYLFDNSRHIALLFQIDEGIIRYIDEILLDELSSIMISRVYYLNGNIYIFSFYGIKDGYQVFVFDENFKFKNKFHKRHNEARAETYCGVTLSKDRIFMLDSFNFDKNEFYESFVYVYDLNGKYLRKFDVGNKKIADIDIDKSGNILIVTYMDEFKVDTKLSFKLFDINGKFLKSLNEAEHFQIKNFIGINYTMDFRNKIYVKIKENKLECNVYNFDLGLK